MKAEDIPSDNTLRDHLLRKIDGSQALHVDLTIFKGRDNDDKKKSYSELLEIMRRHIARAREDRNIAARDKFATDYTNLGKPSTPAPKPTAPTPTPKDGKGGKPSAPAPKGKPGAPVLPSGNPKSHGKGRGKGGKRSRSPFYTGYIEDLFVTSTSTRATANMVTSASIVTPNIIGTRGRTKVAKARTADRLLQEDRRPLVERRIDIAMVG